MKKSITLILILSAITLISPAQNRWNIGLNLSGTGNYSKFSSGMTEASALFTNNIFGSAQLGIEFRYKYTERWSFKTGLNFSEFGFSYLLAQDYNILKPEEHQIELRTGTCISQIPAMAIYQSKLNCRNIRFIAGAGLAFNAIDNNWVSNSTAAIEEEGVLQSSNAEMTIEASAVTTASASFIWMIGTEKVFKRGNMLTFSLNACHGFSNIAESTVDYKAAGKNYTHTFVNNGSWAGIGVTYYFLPIGSKKLNRMK